VRLIGDEIGNVPGQEIERLSGKAERLMNGDSWLHNRRDVLTRIIHECRRGAFEIEARRGFSQVRPTEAYWQSVEEAEREKPRRARGSDDVAGIHE
jgi:hypothetical protein